MEGIKVPCPLPPPSSPYIGALLPFQTLGNQVLTLTFYKSVFLWQVFFLSGFVFIKVSICLTLLRIAVIKWHRITLWVLITISVVSTIFVDFYVLLQCQPIAATWGEVKGTCLPSTITVSITFIISAFNLVTDVLTSLLPFLMLRGVQMTKQKKTAIISILSLGVLASIATIARLPFAQAYFATSDYLGMSSW